MTARVEDAAYDAVLLAGGSGRRFGADKTAALVAGVPLLDRVLAAVVSADRRIVVGVPRPVRADVIWTREDPPGAGPAAGAVAGLAHVRAPWTVLLAGDLPFVDGKTVRRLLDSALASGQGALLVDAGGRRQHLSVVVRSALLRDRAQQRDWTDASMRTLLAGLSLAEVAACGDEARDVDTPGDLPGQAPAGAAVQEEER
ncbi:MAG: NTP transferase domain-containing protein [Actinomycetota bacterium]|nr:NTP transferase domain-containing protein [Actinomycetota bacterium]